MPTSFEGASPLSPPCRGPPGSATSPSGHRKLPAVPCRATALKGMNKHTRSQHKVYRMTCSSLAAAAAAKAKEKAVSFNTLYGMCTHTAPPATPRHPQHHQPQTTKRVKVNESVEPIMSTRELKHPPRTHVGLPPLPVPRLSSSTDLPRPANEIAQHQKTGRTPSSQTNQSTMTHVGLPVPGPLVERLVEMRSVGPPCPLLPFAAVLLLLHAAFRLAEDLSYVL